MESIVLVKCEMEVESERDERKVDASMADVM